MMTRTQIYLPEDLHASLMQLARQQSTTMSNLVRQGANLVVKKRGGNASLKRALLFFANPPKRYRLNKTGKQLIEEMSRDRDDD